MVEIAKTLYTSRNKLEVSASGSSVGKTGIAGVATSEHRGVTYGAPKISYAARFFDKLLKHPGKLAVYTNADSVFLEDTENETGVFISDGGNHATFCEKNGENSHVALLGQVAYFLSDLGSNEELKNVCRDSIYEFEASGAIADGSLFLFCDSYYYGCVKGEKNILTDVATEAEMKAAFRAGNYTQHQLLRANAKKHLGKSKYDSSAAEPKATKTKTTKAVDFLKECKEGKYKVHYEWPEAMKRYVVSPSFLDNFETTPEFEEIVKKIYFRSQRILSRLDMGLTGAEAIGKDYLNIMLLGKPGTGKTTLAYALSAATGMPVCTTVHNKHTDEDEYEGKTKIVDGKPAFVETDSLLFHENGGIDINEEINLADPSVTMGGLGQKVEYPFIVKKNGYETKVRHPLNVVIATMNVGTNGSNPLNQALANRFKTPYILDDPTKETFINILMKSSGKDENVCSWIYGAYEKVVDYLKSPAVNEDEVCQNLSIRTCLGAIENMEEGQEPIRALVNSIVGAVAIVDLELARKLQKEVIEALPNPSFEF